MLQGGALINLATIRIGPPDVPRGKTEKFMSLAELPSPLDDLTPSRRANLHKPLSSATKEALVVVTRLSSVTDARSFIHSFIQQTSVNMCWAPGASATRDPAGRRPPGPHRVSTGGGPAGKAAMKGRRALWEGPSLLACGVAFSDGRPPS